MEAQLERLAVDHHREPDAGALGPEAAGGEVVRLGGPLDDRPLGGEQRLRHPQPDAQDRLHDLRLVVHVPRPRVDRGGRQPVLVSAQDPAQLAPVHPLAQRAVDDPRWPAAADVERARQRVVTRAT
ncbi:hypothetical protein [Miltoncostaea marina]|uniref:hypothetical protein n=1 Tax=Miltoncostaea marina TaxID=2843215 RepID=UPI001C3CFD43|nr:hypothetical protein [Miltoncostaea marina]